MQSSGNRKPYLLGDAHVEPALGEIRLRDNTRRIEPRLMAVLKRLVDRRGQVVSRQELLDAIWRGDVAGDESLTQAVSGLRRVLGDSARSPRYIQTIPKAGYRLIATVTSPENRVALRFRPILAAAITRAGGRWPLYAATLIVMLVAAGIFVAYDDPNPDWNTNPNPDYDIEIEDLNFD